MKIADLFAQLAIKTDRRAVTQARDELGRFVKGANKELDKVRKVKPGGFLGRQLNDFGGALGGGAIGAAALGAGLLSAAKDAIAFDDQLTSLDIASQGAMGSMDAVRERILAVSRATGVAKEQLLQGASTFVALTGDGKAASASLETFAKIQKATGANMEDISSSAAALSQQLGIGPDQMEKAFSILIRGGKKGAVELKDMASLMASLSAKFSQFGESQGAGGLASLGAAFQIARQGFGSASETATGLEALMGSMIQNAKKLKKQGVNVFEKDGKTLKSLDAIVNSLANKKFNATKLIELLGRKEAMAAFNQLVKNRAAWGDLADATMTANDVAEDYARRQASSSAKISKSWNDVKIRIAEAFTPERVEGMANAIEKLAGRVSKLINGLETLNTKLAWAGGIGGVLETTPLGGGGMALDAGSKVEDVMRTQIDQRTRSWGKHTATGKKVNTGEWGRPTVPPPGMAAPANEVFTPESPTVPGAPPVYGPGGSTTSSQVNNITINAAAADAKEVAKEVDRQIIKKQNAMLRNAAAATGVR